MFEQTGLFMAQHKMGAWECKRCAKLQKGSVTECGACKHKRTSEDPVFLQSPTRHRTRKANSVPCEQKQNVAEPEPEPESEPEPEQAASFTDASRIFDKVINECGTPGSPAKPTPPQTPSSRMRQQPARAQRRLIDAGPSRELAPEPIKHGTSGPTKVASKEDGGKTKK